MRRLLIAATVLLGLPLVGVVVVASAGAQHLVVPTDSSSSEPGPDPDPDDTSDPFVTTYETVSVTLVDKGAAVDVQFTVTCDDVGLLRVGVTQRKGNRVVVSNEGVALVNCTREPQTVTVRATVATAGARFKKGKALVDSRLDGIRFELHSSDTIHIK